MTLQEQITAILEHKGWRLIEKAGDHETWMRPNQSWKKERTPNLLDRQVCWDVFEKDADDGYWRELAESFYVDGTTSDDGWHWHEILKLLKATSEQRIEAYVRHVGKWRD